MAKTTKSQAKTNSKAAEKPTKTTASAAATETSVSRSRLAKNDRSSLFSITKVLAELLGTFILTLVVIAAVSGNMTLGLFATPEQTELAAQSGQLAPAFAITPFLASFALGALVLIFGKAAWGHFNPAISLAALAIRRVKPVEAAAAMIGQVLGAMLALVVSLRLFDMVDYKAMQAAAQSSGNSELVYKGLDPMQLFAHTTSWTLFSAELIGAAIFAFGIASLVAHGRSSLTRSVIAGSSLLLGAAVAAAAGAGVLNPAVALGLGLVGFGENAGQIWSLIGIYVAAPIIGAVIGMALYRLVGRQTEEDSATA
ncbi:MAG TPA: aquaporin [Candidatus Saccharimonadales bacterium]